MSTLPLYQNADATSDFMARPESSEKTWVWVPDDIDGYLSGWVRSDKDDMVEVVLDGGRGVCYTFYQFLPVLTSEIRSDDYRDTVYPRRIHQNSIEWTILPTSRF
jgi:hypothetical protein